MDCSRRIEQLSALADNRLRGRKKAKLEAHLAECETCRKVLEDFLALKHQLATLPLHDAPSPGFWNRFSSALDSQPRRSLWRPNFASALATLVVLVMTGLLLFHPGTETPVDADQLFEHHRLAMVHSEWLAPVGDFDFQRVNSQFSLDIHKPTGPASQLSTSGVGVVGAGFWHYGGMRIPFVVFQKDGSPCTIYTIPRKLLSLHQMEALKMPGSDILYRASCGQATILATEANEDFVVAAVSCMPQAEMETLLATLAK